MSAASGRRRTRYPSLGCGRLGLAPKALMATRSFTPGALRQRRFRCRRKHDLLLAKAEVPMLMAEALIDADLLSEADASDPLALGRAIIAAAERLLGGGR